MPAGKRKRGSGFIRCSACGCCCGSGWAEAIPAGGRIAICPACAVALKRWPVALFGKALAYRVVAIAFTALFTGLRQSLEIHLGLTLIYVLFDLGWERLARGSDQRR